LAKPINREILSIGAVLLIVAIAFVLYASLIINAWMMIPLIVAMIGGWLFVLAAMQSRSPVKYGLSSFSILAWGALLLAIGGALLVYSFSWVYAILIIFIVLGAVAIAAAIGRK